MKMKYFTLFISFDITFIFFCSSETTTTGTINWWCTQTPYYQTCNHYVVDVEGNHFNTTISINQFLNMNVQLAINEARVVLKRTQGIESTYPNAPGKSLWGSCVDYFDGIVFTLNMVFDHTLKPTPLDVHTWISAGLTYISTCEKGFELINVNNTMLREMSKYLTEVLLNSLAISVVIASSNTRGLVVDWNVSDEYYKLSDFKKIQPDVVVAKDGSGNFTTVQEAVNSARYRKEGKRYVIYVKSGVYEEHVKILLTVNDITMFGDGINKTIITGDRHLGGDIMQTAKAGDLKETSTFQVWGRGFIARDMTFRNTAGPEGAQAIAFLSGSDRSALYHCSIEGYQDTLYTFGSRQFYKECQIFGTVDFIFGAAQAVFQDCNVFFRKPLHGGGLVATANGRQYGNQSGGYSLQGCNIGAADDLKPVVGQYHKAYLGRPWFKYARTVYMQSFIDDLVDPTGWLDTWGYNETIYYGEYKNSGSGSSTNNRVKWHGYHVITDPKVARQFTVADFIEGNQWLPDTGVPFIPGFKNH